MSPLTPGEYCISSHHSMIISMYGLEWCFFQSITFDHKIIAYFTLFKVEVPAWVSHISTTDGRIMRFLNIWESKTTCIESECFHFYLYRQWLSSFHTCRIRFISERLKSSQSRHGWKEFKRTMSLLQFMAMNKWLCNWHSIRQTDQQIPSHVHGFMFDATTELYILPRCGEHVYIRASIPVAHTRLYIWSQSIKKLFITPKLYLHRHDNMQRRGLYISIYTLTC